MWDHFLRGDSKEYENIGEERGGGMSVRQGWIELYILCVQKCVSFTTR